MEADRMHLCPHCDLHLATAADWREHLEEDHGTWAAPSRPTGQLVVAVDPTHPRGEVAVAAAFANQTHQTLDLIAVPPSGFDHGSTDAFLRSCVHTARDAGVSTIAWTVLEGPNPAPAILEHLRSAGGTMVCLGTRARSALRELLLGSVSEPVVRESPVPVVLVGPRCVLPSDGRYRRVVACVDGTEGSAAVLVTAERVAQLAQVPAEEFRAAAPSWDGDEDLAVLADPPPLGGEAAATAVLDHLHGDPATIAVVGTEGRRGFDRLLFASVAMEVTRRARGPVVVLPPALDVDALTRTLLRSGT